VRLAVHPRTEQYASKYCSIISFLPFINSVLSPLLLAPAGASNDRGHRKLGDMSSVWLPHLFSFVQGPQRKGVAGSFLLHQRALHPHHVASQRRPGVLFWLNVLISVVRQPTRTVQYFSRRRHPLSRSANSSPCMKAIGKFSVRFGVLRGSLVTIAVLWNALPCSSVLCSDVLNKQQPVMLELPFQTTR